MPLKSLLKIVSVLAGFLFMNIPLVKADDLDTKAVASAKVKEFYAPKIDIESLSIASIDLTALNLALRLKVTNTSSQDVTVTSVIYEVHAMSTTINGRIDQLEKFIANEQRIVSVPVALQHSSSSLIILDALKSESRIIPYKILGKIKIQGINEMLPFEHLGEYVI